MGGLIIAIPKGQAMAGSMVADRRLWLSADRANVLEEGDPGAALLLAGEGSEIAPDEAARLGLELVDGRIVQKSLNDVAGLATGKRGKTRSPEA